MLPFISIIVPVFREGSLAAELADSLKKLDYPAHEVIFVLDKNADEATERALRRSLSSGMKVFRNTKKGSAAHRNFGVKKADKRAKYFAFTDADCIVEKNWLRVLANEIGSQPNDVGCVGGINLVPKKAGAFEQVAGALEGTLLGGGGSSQGTRFRNKVFVPSIPNCNALYRKELWIKNRQDENLMVGQDGEFNYRLWKKGSKFLITPKAIVYHHRPDNPKRFAKRIHAYGIATAKIFKMHPEILKVRWYSLASVFALIIGIVLLAFSFYNAAALRILLLLLVIYLALLLITAFEVYFRTKKKLSFITPFLLMAQHLLYPLGFIRGLLFR